MPRTIISRDILRSCPDASPTPAGRPDCRYRPWMFGKGPRGELVMELAQLRKRVAELEAEREGAIRAAGASMGVAGLERGMGAEGLLARARVACARAQAAGGGRAVLAPASGDDGAIGADGADAPQRDAIEALAVALLERDRYTGEHSE